MSVAYQKIAVVLVGNATHDAELKKAKESEKMYCDFSLAVLVAHGETTYFPIRCFGKLTIGMIALKKGTKVFVEGELKISSFAGEEGGKRLTYWMLANTYRVFSNGRRADASEEIVDPKYAEADHSL